MLLCIDEKIFCTVWKIIVYIILTTKIILLIVPNYCTLILLRMSKACCHSRSWGVRRQFTTPGRPGLMLRPFIARSDRCRDSEGT